MQRGDRVRATMEGDVVGIGNDMVELKLNLPGGGMTGHAFLPRILVNFETVPPPEPPGGSVVIDCDGDAWQRDGCDDDEYQWQMSGASEDGVNFNRTWDDLIDTYGPVKVVYTP